jgi:ribosomal protein S18 acetylase RimI-like enzyme
MKNTQFSHAQDPHIIPITIENHQEFHKFLNQDILISRHLDWFTPSDWIGHQPFIAEEVDHHLQAVLLSAPDIPGFTWIRLFGAEKTLAIEQVWYRLLTKALSDLKEMGVSAIAALGTDHWFTSLLIQGGFEWQADISVLEWPGAMIMKPIASPGVVIRTMDADDLPNVFQIDQLAFTPQFQNSLQALSNAFNQNTLCTVALKQGQIVGYQISTRLTVYGHLARLAVHPAYHNQQIASLLVFNLLDQFKNSGVTHVTVNTQANNRPSLAVYQKFGFKSTNEHIPVYHRLI